MINLGVISTSAVFEPRTTVTAATDFPRFRDDAAVGAYGNDGCRRGCRCVYVVIGHNTKIKTRKHSLLVCEKIYLPGISIGLTFAGFHSLKPHVISVSVAGTSTVLVPITARSATTGSP